MIVARRDNYQVFTLLQRKKKTSVNVQQEDLRASRLTDADVMDMRRETYDALFYNRRVVLIDAAQV